VPEADHSVASPADVGAAMRAVTVDPLASGIWLANVRCHTSS
jgi:hypothetical protein